MRKRVIQIVVGVGLLIIVLLAVLWFFLDSIVKRGVETIGPTLAKVEVRLGSVNLSPLSGQGHLTELFVGNPEGFKTPSAIKVGDIQVSLNIGSLLSDTVVIESLTIGAPEITFEGSLSGSNLSTILENLEAAAGSDRTGKTEKSQAKNEKKFQVKDVLVTGGRIHLSMNLLGGKALTVPLSELHLQNVGTASDAVSAAELSRQIMKPLLASVTKVVSEAIVGVGKGVKEIGKDVQEIGKGAADKVEKAAKGIKDLFKK